MITMDNQIIDFNELISPVPGEGLEQLTRQIGRKMGLSPSWSGRGADGGRDLIFTEILAGLMAKEKITWLVSCKDKAKSGKSVSEKDLPSTGIMDKLIQHKAQGFLLVTTTTVSTGAKALLDSLDKNNGGDIYTLVWDSSELTAILLDPTYKDLLKQFLPQSYRRLMGLNSLEGALLSFQDEIPEEVMSEVLRLVKPYGEMSLKGSKLWPYDVASADVIDDIVSELLNQKNPEDAVLSTENIEFDAFMVFIEKLHTHYPEECREYLFATATKHKDPDVQFNAVQFIFDNYEISARERIELSTHLDENALEEVYSSEIIAFIEGELFHNTPQYSLYDDLDQLSSATRIDLIDISQLVIKPEDNHRIGFSGTMLISVTLEYSGEQAGNLDFPGYFEGYFDENGIYLESATVDTSSYYE